MKRKIIILTIATLALSALAGCGQRAGESNTPDATNATGGQTRPATWNNTNLPATNGAPSTNSIGTNTTVSDR
jgi:predicted small lipoprotein YifL